jgi:predicted flavoprotein YhiN
MCAAVAGQRGRRVALLEHNGQPGRKILISGGGRCNFTNLHCEPENFLSENPHFAKSALALYQPQHFLELVKRYGIPWHEKALGQLFCDGSARAILEMLLAECERGGVEIELNAQQIEVEASSGEFYVGSSCGEFRAGSLVVATGGLSIPKLGATGVGYDLARQFGLAVVEPRPALVPLLLGGAEAGWTELAGVALEVVAWAEPRPKRHFSGARAQAHSSGSIYGLKPAPFLKPVPFREKMLVTHRGLSGPAVLQASSHWLPGEALVVDFAPGIVRSDPGRKDKNAAKAGQPGIETELLGALRQPGARRDLAAVKQALRRVLPLRLADCLAEAGAPEGWSNAALAECEQRLHRWEFHPVGSEGFEKAEVTAGGVDTRGLQARTMEARAVPGLFFIGELVDVTGQLGGYNFQWAWASGAAAGRSV